MVLKKRKIVLICLFAISLVLLVLSCNKSSTRVQNKAFFEYFDTVSYIYSYAGDSRKNFEKNSEEVKAVLEKYHRLLDIYHEYADMNNLCTVNQNAGKEPVKVDKELIDFLVYAKQMHDLTKGKMNIAMGSVLRLWHDARTSQVPYIPDEEELKNASLHINIDCLEIDEINSTVRLLDSLASLDVGALGKGYAAEKAAEKLIKSGVDSYVLNIGGNIRIVGKKPDKTAWKTGIKNPVSPDGPFAITIQISDISCVTSGNYERYFTFDGKKYHHIIDNKTLMPADNFGSVTVICKDSALADSFSTALFCMDKKTGLELVDSIDGLDCIWISNDGEVSYSKGIEKYLIDR